MMLRLLLIARFLSSFRSAAAAAVSLLVLNRCKEMVWPVLLTDPRSPRLPGEVSSLQLASGGYTVVKLPAGCSGRIWGRTGCTATSGVFSCSTGDCGTGRFFCFSLPAPPVTFVELADHRGTIVYQVSLAAGFNLPVSLVARHRNDCPVAVCRADVNAACPPELQVRGGRRKKVIGCKSACQALGTDADCCTGKHRGSSARCCPPTKFGMFFKSQCPVAMAYFDDGAARRSCPGGSSFALIFCP